MSYFGSHLGHSDLQLLQNRVMVARLQELQKHQQHGQLGDVKSQSPMTTHLSRFGKQASGGQIPNFSGGLVLNSSDVFAANNMNWMHHNVSSPVQCFPSNSYLHDQGLMMNPSLQQPDVSLYGTPIASGRTNMGHYSPLHGGVSLQNSHHTNSPQNNMSLLNYSGMDEQSSGTGFLHEKSKYPSDSGGTAELDPLEEKILFDTENSGWDSSLSKLAALDAEEYANSSGVTETMNPFSTVQSGSWSALMQSAVAEVSSSDTGVQEELSGLSYQNMELSTDNQPSNLVTSTPQHFKCNDSKSESSSCNLKTPPSSCDSIMSSSMPNFQQTGLQSSFEQGLNKFSSDINIEQWSRLSQSLQTQQQPNQYLPSKHVRNDGQGDVFCGIGSSVLSTSDTNRSIYGQNQRRTSGDQYLSIADGTLNQKENDNKSLRYDDGPLKNGPMDVDATNKNAAHTYVSQTYQGENSSDSYNSKVSHTYTAQPNHACLNAADSESSARSSQKSPNQALCISSPGADSQQECFSSIKSDNVLHTNSDSAIQGKHNQSEDALSKCSPASNICASMDSKNTPEHNKGSLVSDRGGTTTQDIFSFQSSMFGDSVSANLGNGQKDLTWWMPSSFGQSVPALQGASAQKWSARSSNLGNSGFEISNLKSERLSHGSIFPGPSYTTNQIEGNSMSDMSVPSQSMSKRAEMGQQVSLTGSSQGSCLLDHAGITGFQNYASRTFQNTLPYISHLNQHRVNPHSAQMSMSSQEDVMFDTYFNGKDWSSLVDPSARNSEITINGEGQLDKVRFNEQKSSQNQGGEIFELTEKSKMCFGDASMYVAGSPTHQGSAITDQINKSYSWSLQSYNFTENAKFELDPSISANVAECDVSKGDFKSHTHAPILNSDIYWQQRVHQAHMLASNQHNQSIGNNDGYDVISNLSSGAQILSPFDASKVSSTRQAETFQLSGRHTDAVDGGMSCILANPANQMVTNQQVLASSMLPANADNMNLILSKSRKRKFSTFDGLPWHEKVMQNSWKLPDISVAEQVWAKATNRLVEERVNENDSLEEMRPVARGKKRLILTSQLMQQVFLPPPPSILRVDATSDYELMAYFVTKFALADACKLTSKPRILIPRAYGDMIINASSNDHNSVVKDAEVLVERAMKLESQIKGLNGSLSTVDIRRECQELEKCSLINHFVKHHGRLAQSNTTDTQSPFLQRYVNPTLSPQKVPEGTKCLSL